MQPQAFCFMMKGFLEGKEKLSETDTNFVREQLHNVFKHVIDKQYPEDGGKSQAIHDGNKPTIGGKDANGMLMRC